MQMSLRITVCCQTCLTERSQAWNILYDFCQDCREVEYPHQAKGLCTRCSKRAFKQRRRATRMPEQCQTCPEIAYCEQGMCDACRMAKRLQPDGYLCEKCGARNTRNFCQLPRSLCDRCLREETEVIYEAFCLGKSANATANQLVIGKRSVGQCLSYFRQPDRNALPAFHTIRVIAPKLQLFHDRYRQSIHQTTSTRSSRWKELHEMGLAGDTTAWPQIIEEARGMIMGLVKNFFLPGAERDDLFQEGQFGLWKGLRDWKPDGGLPLVPFLKMAARRQMITAIQTAVRQKHRHLNQARSYFAPRGSEDERLLIETMVGDHSAEDYVLDRVIQATSDDLAVLRRLNPKFLANLSPLERTSISRFLLGESYQEIGQRLARKSKNIDNALQRVRTSGQKIGRANVILDFEEVT